KVRLRQFLMFVWGKIHCSALNRTYSIRGQVRNNTFNGEYSLANSVPIGIDRCSFALEIQPSGNELSGLLICVGGITASCDAGTYRWNRAVARPTSPEPSAGQVADGATTMAASHN